ncbi:MAG: phosphoribosylformylglycinamidine cyclo-ligase [Desulfurococcaceae archaeon]
MRYRDAGVDLDIHKQMHMIARKIVEKTSSHIGVEIGNIGGYVQFIRSEIGDIGIHVDGVGTKTLVLLKTGKLRIAGWDCVVMNANDIACDGFRALAFSDYIAMEKPDINMYAEVMKGIEDALIHVKAPIISGETAIMPGVVRGLDVVCIALAIRRKPFQNKAQSYDVVIGVNSYGLHANGYSLARKIVEEVIGDYNKEIDGINIGDELSKPTAMYYNLALEAVENGIANSIAHVTGGGWSKLKRVLSESLDMELRPPPPMPIFRLLMEKGDIPLDEAYRVFNMGIGLVLTTHKSRVDELVSMIHRHGFYPYILGHVKPGQGIVRLHIDWAGDRVVEL